MTYEKKKLYQKNVTDFNLFVQPAKRYEKKTPQKLIQMGNEPRIFAFFYYVRLFFFFVIIIIIILVFIKAA